MDAAHDVYHLGHAEAHRDAAQRIRVELTDLRTGGGLIDGAIARFHHLGLLGSKTAPAFAAGRSRFPLLVLTIRGVDFPRLAQCPGSLSDRGAHFSRCGVEITLRQSGALGSCSSDTVAVRRLPGK